MPRFAIGVCLCWTTLACAAEVAVLDNGMRLRAERVERDGARTILYMSGGGRIELDTARVAQVEPEPAPPQRLAADGAAVPAALSGGAEAPRGLKPAPLPAAPLAPLKPVRELVTEAALRHGLPPEFVHGVAQAESAYRTTAVSPKGALGVMQLMPETARRLNADPSDIEQNIDAGTRLLRDLLLRYQGTQNGVRRALAAYNAGEAAVERYHGVPPYAETQGYVERVIANYWKNVRATSAQSSGTQ